MLLPLEIVSIKVGDVVATFLQRNAGMPGTEQVATITGENSIIAARYLYLFRLDTWYYFTSCKTK